jgi:hypothetical protein
MKGVEGVGFEPTTSASFLQRQLYLLSNGQQQSEEYFLTVQIPTRSTILLALRLRLMVHGYGAKNTASKHIKSLSFDGTGK